MNILPIFCDVDDFCLLFEPRWHQRLLQSGAASDKLLLRKRTLMETVNDQLKNISQIEHTRHLSLWNFLGNVAAGLIAYSWREKKPSLNIRVKELFIISN